jgi:hypothetical protein
MNFRFRDCIDELGYQLDFIDIGASDLDEILVDDPIWSFLDHLCQIIYCLPAFEGDLNPAQIGGMRWVIEKTLCWVQQQQEVSSLKLRRIPAETEYSPAPQALKYTPCPAKKTLHFG